MILEDAYENSYITYVANHCLSMTTAWVNVLVVIKSALYTLQGGYILYWMEAGSLSSDHALAYCTKFPSQEFNNWMADFRKPHGFCGACGCHPMWVRCQQAACCLLTFISSILPINKDSRFDCKILALHLCTVLSRGHCS